MPQLHATTFVALGLLAYARCAVYTDSGFSRIAFYWGRDRQRDCVAVIPRSNVSLQLFEGLWERRKQQRDTAANGYNRGAAGATGEEEEAVGKSPLPPRVCATHPPKELELELRGLTGAS